MALRSATREPDGPPGGSPPTRDDDPLTRIWERLARPFDVAETVDAILGLSPAVVRQFVGTQLATSAEAYALLEPMGSTIRSLATSMATQAERCMGDIRGPILWSETISARAASNGAEDLFICATPSRAYDVTENRVLVAALYAVLEGAIDASIVSEKVYDDEALREARRQGERARLFLQHPSLRSVTVERPSGRAMKRTRSGKSRKTYEPALAMLARRSEPLDPNDIASFSDRRTTAQHRVLMALVDRLEQGGTRLPDFRVEQGVLYAGPLQYHHPRTRGNITRMSGIVIGNLLVDVPDRLRERNRDKATEELRARAHGRTCMVVMDHEDIEAAFGLAISLARR